MSIAEDKARAAATAIRARGESPFPGAGEGVVLRFRNSDLKRIEAKNGDGFFNEFLDKCLSGRIGIEMLEFYVEQGAKKNGEPFQVSPEVLDEIPVHDLAELVLDAICISVKGLPAKEYVEKAFKAFQEDPTPLSESPETTSTNFVNGASGPDSDSMTSGTTAPAK